MNMLVWSKIGRMEESTFPLMLGTDIWKRYGPIPTCLGLKGYVVVVVFENGMSIFVSEYSFIKINFCYNLYSLQSQKLVQGKIWSNLKNYRHK